MIKLFKNLEIEWKIILLAALVLIAFSFPLQSIYINKLKATLNQSRDYELEPLLRSFLSTHNDIQKRAIRISLERNRQWQALIPIIIEEQSFALILISIILFISLLLLSFWSLKRLTKPLKDLATAADNIGKGNNVSIKFNAGGALGKLEKSMITMQDELIKLRERAHTQGMESAWRDIARVMAHEIKNPLTPIQLTLDRIQDRLDCGSDLSKQEMLKFVNRISAQVITLEHLVNDFKSFAKEPEPVCTPVSLSECIKSISMDMSGFLETTLDHDAIVIADCHLLNRVFLNIWKNSYEAGATKISVTIEQLNSSIILRIVDNGSGIPPELIERVWIPYTTFKKGGTGLGLPVVKRLLESMGAVIEMKSSINKENHGVSIIIKFSK